MRRRVLAFAVSLAAVAGAASAEPPPPPQPTEAAPPLPMDEEAAFRPPQEQVFISPAGEPFRAPPEAPYPVGSWFDRADADHDGVLTAAEFAADSLAFFKRLDSDGDGRVDGFENADYEKDVAPEINGVLRRPPVRPAGEPYWRPLNRGDLMWGRAPLLAPRRGSQMPPKRVGAAQYGLLNEPHPVRGGDGDLDGKITRTEAEAAARRRFGLLDTDGDGKLMLSDLPKTPAQLIYGEADGPPRRKP